MSLALSVHRIWLTLTSLMPSWWRARLMANATLATSLGIRAKGAACTNSKVRRCMVGCGLGVGFLLEDLVAFLLWATFHSPAGGVAATEAKDLLH